MMGIDTTASQKKDPFEQFQEICTQHGLASTIISKETFEPLVQDSQDREVVKNTLIALLLADEQNSHYRPESKQ